jgi:Family of unknown function (DUF6682)
MGGLSVTTKTVQNVLDRVTRQFGDESGSQVTTADIIRWINAAQTEIVLKNRILKAQSTTASVAAQSDYTFSSLSVLNIEHLHYKGVPLKYLGFIEAQEYINNYDPNQDYSDTPYIWYEWGTVIKLYPVPSVSGDTITLYYIQMPTDVVNTTDTLAVPDIYFESLVQYVLSQAYEQDDDMNSASFKRQQMDVSLNTLSEDAMTAMRGRYPTITVLEEDM